MKIHILLLGTFISLFFFIFLVKAGSNDTWKSCCSSGCNYTINQRVGGYICCSDGWHAGNSCQQGGIYLCTRYSPSVTISPYSQNGNPGQTLSYTVTVTNNDDSACGPSTFILSYNCPSGFTCSLASNSLTISPGSSASTTIYVTSPSTAISGIYIFNVTATNINSGFSNIAYGSYVINVGSCSYTPPKIYLGNAVSSPGGDLNVIVDIKCSDWSFTAKNLTLNLKIDDTDWNECFLNKTIGLVTDLKWNGTEGDSSSIFCKRNNWMSNGQWYCSDCGKCSNKNYPINVFSNSTEHRIVLNFTCTLPSNLSPGSHTLTVYTRIYSSEIQLAPTKTSFIVYSTPLIIKWPIEILKAILKIFSL